MASALTSSLRPRAGAALVRPIEAENRLPGSRLYLPDQSVDRMTTNQMELLAMGPPPVRDEPDPHTLAHDAAVQALPVGAWLVLKPRSWIEGPTPDTYLISQDAILGAFA